jgi:hypothetical protein
MQHLIGASISISVTAEGSVPRRLHGQWLIAAFRASLNRYHIAWSAPVPALEDGVVLQRVGRAGQRPLSTPTRRARSTEQKRAPIG